MSDVIYQGENNQGDNTDTNLSITFTQISCCVIGAEFIEHRRQSLRAKLEREQFERKKRRQHSFSNTFRNLFGLSRNRDWTTPPKLVPDKIGKHPILEQTPSSLLLILLKISRLSWGLIPGS